MVKFMTRVGVLRSAIAANVKNFETPKSGDNSRLRRLLAISALSTLLVSGCAGSTAPPTPPANVFGQEQRLLPPGEIPKGGGIYKVGNPYQVKGRWYIPSEQPGYDKTGWASWYGSKFHGKRTSNGEIYNMHALTAAHQTLPMPSYAYVTDLDNQRTVLVRINDRGPFKNDRMLDVSARVARELGFKTQGLARVRVRYAGKAPLDGNDVAEQRHLSRQNWYRRAGYQY